MICPNLLNHHYSVENNLLEVIRDEEDSALRELFELLAQHPEETYPLFRQSCNLTELLGLFLSLRHWVHDDGTFMLRRKVNESATELRARLADKLGKERTVVYEYYIEGGEYYNSIEHVPVTPTLILKVLELELESQAYYQAHKSAIEESWECEETKTYMEMNRAKTELLETYWSAH